MIATARGYSAATEFLAQRAAQQPSDAAFEPAQELAGDAAEGVAGAEEDGVGDTAHSSILTQLHYAGAYLVVDALSASALAALDVLYAASPIAKPNGAREPLGVQLGHFFTVGSPLSL